jgi:hypothetical protein
MQNSGEREVADKMLQGLGQYVSCYRCKCQFDAMSRDQRDEGSSLP